jgi:DUF971 family protein
MDIPLPPNDRIEKAELLGVILILHWKDGHRSELPLTAVRRACPCAVCGGAGSAPKALNVLPPAGMTEVVAIEPVGRYALQLHWKDGHATGIYSFDLLRALCECPECAAAPG